MRQKVLQARHMNLDEFRPGYPHVEPYDELAMFGGRTGLVLPKRASPAPTSILPPTRRQPAIPNIPPPSLTAPNSLVIPDNLFRNNTRALHDLFADETLTTFESLPPNWENLYREIPEPSYSYGMGNSFPNAPQGLANPPGDGVMLEDRWSSFMHQYGTGMLGQVQQSQI